MSDAHACRSCLRRAWLLERLAGRIDLVGRRPGGVTPLFALDDQVLIEAVGGAADRELTAGWRAFDEGEARRRVTAAAMTTTCPHVAGYPESLRGWPGAPAALGILGDRRRFVALHAEPVVAVVGARRASDYGLEVARSLGRGLAAAGVTVVSGMAFGIDAAAHAGALEVGGTIAVLAGGADSASPAAHRALHRRIATHGAVISELPPGARPRRFGFPARNRIIAGLAAMTVVVEATWASGALGTARATVALGRDVGAVPGRITSPLAAGPNALIADGAALVRDARDVLDAVCGVGRPETRDPPPAEPVPGHLQRLLDAVGDGHDTAEALEAGGWSSDTALAGLVELELLGRVRRGTGGRWVVSSAAGASGH